MNSNLLQNSFKISLFFQVLSGIIPIEVFFGTVKKEDRILLDILRIETVVQFIELLFYVWISFAVVNVNLITSRRYVDWFITTPMMLTSTAMYMKYKESKSSRETLTVNLFLKRYKYDLLEICIYNALMLFFGFLGEVEILPKYISVPVGFIFFLRSFYIIFEKFARKTEEGTKLFYFVFYTWSLYGVAALLDTNPKNISYNLLDLVSKNFYGLFLYYKIKKLQS